MSIRTFLVSFLCLGARLIAEVTLTQQAVVADLKDYHKDIAAFESLAARAVREGIPDSVITTRRYFYYMQHGEIASLRVLIPQMQNAKKELLSQEFEPMTEAVFEKMLEVGRKLIEASEKNPAGAAALVSASHRFAQATIHLKDLRLIYSAVQQYAIENKRSTGDPVPVEAWKQYLPKNQRLWRTGADCLGNAYGPQVVDRRPTLARAAYERIADSVPKDYFKPFEVAEQ